MKTYAYNHSPIQFDFLQSVERFYVEEIPLYKPSGKGEYLFLNIKKYDLSTWRLIHVIKQATGANDRDIGYAGLKDKNATAIQQISIPKRFERSLSNIDTKRIEILSTNYNHSPLKIGHLKGNKFQIILSDINAHDAARFVKVAKTMSQDGIPNYFGYQRFGEDGKSWQQGKEIAQSGKKLKGAKEKLLVSAYQGYLFNKWLAQRIGISKVVTESTVELASQRLGYPKELVTELAKQPHFFKIFLGDCILNYPNGKSNYCKDMTHTALRFSRAELSPTGLLAGDKINRAMSDARHLEEPYDDEELSRVHGDRRWAWVWPSDIETEYDRQTDSLNVQFYLPKGSYATSFLEEIAKKSLMPAR